MYKEIYIDIKKLDKATKLLAQGMSKREMLDHGINRDVHGHYFRSKSKVSQESILKICADVKKNKLGYLAVKKKYGKRGLMALYCAYEAYRLEERKRLAQRILDLRINQNMPIKKIASTLKCEDHFITKVLHENLKDVRQLNLSLRKGIDTDKRVLELYNAGERDSRKLADKAGISRAHVYAVLNDHGIRSIKRPYTESDFMMIHKLKKHLSWPEIAAIFDVTVSSVSNYYYKLYPKMYALLKEDSNEKSSAS